MAESSSPTELPPQFGHYRVKKKLGGGGMGTVYLVENTQLEREEALKVPHFSDGDDTQVRERFLREARSAAKLDHANLCPVYHAGVQDGVYFLTMRFLKGKLLSDYTGTAQPARKAVEIVIKLAQALEAAHEKGVIHRDLKPSNVMMVAGAGPVVMDFGLAKEVRQTAKKLTQTGAILGTPSYMPPEQVKGDLERMGPASDVYSLGVILFELLTGQLPFGGPLTAVLAQILFNEPPLPSALVPGLDPALDAICRKAMAKEATERYPSMKAFAAVLTVYLRTAPAKGGGRVPLGAGDLFQAPTMALRPRVPTTVPPRLGASTPVAKAWPAPPRRFLARPWVLGGVLVLLAGLVGASYLATFLLRVETKAGSVFLEIDQKDAEVSVDGNKITIGRPGDKDTITVEAKEGKHLLRVTKEGFEAWTDDITFRANEPYRVKISLKRVQVARNSAKGKEESLKTVPAPKKATEPAPTRVAPRPGTTTSNDIRTKKEEPAPKIAPVQNEPLGMKFVKLSKGTFWMSEGGKNAQKQVTIGADFELAAYTVTQAQWQEVMAKNPSYFSRQGLGKQAVEGISDEELQRFPVETVSWNDVQEYLKKLNDRETGRGWLYRLPSEAEWEYACRGGATSQEDCSLDFYLDRPSNDLSSDQANFNGDYPAGNGAKGPYLKRTTKVGSYRANKLGLYDMHGNVWQWCSDVYDAAGSVRVIRGGSWGVSGQYCRAANRDRVAPTDRGFYLGFRLARVPSGN